MDKTVVDLRIANCICGSTASVKHCGQIYEDTLSEPFYRLTGAQIWQVDCQTPANHRIDGRPVGHAVGGVNEKAAIANWNRNMKDG